MSPMRFVILHSPQDAAGALYLGDILSRHPRVGVASLTASVDAPRLSELWQEAARPRKGSAYGDAPSAVGLLLPSDALDRQPQLLGPLQQALAAGSSDGSREAAAGAGRSSSAARPPCHLAP